MAFSGGMSMSIDDGVDEEVELGFLEKTPTDKLQSHLFPCKFGGKPAWLSLKPLPTTDDLMCPRCNELCVFLLQVFAPQNEMNHCFHRTIFIFLCKNGKCHKPNDTSTILVFRCQLPRENEFYSAEPPDEDEVCEDPPNAGKHNPLCIVCGCLGDKKCAQCKKAYYCSKTHQTIDWKFHKKVCKELRQKPEENAFIVESDASINLLFPEYEIVIEPENYIEDVSERSEEERLAEYKNYLSSNPANSSCKEKGVDTDLLEMSMTVDDKEFWAFQKRVKHEPDQVIRYQRGASPLWASNCNLAKVDDILPCEYCGTRRVFEFQVMPQLLRYMNVDSVSESIDWATIAVYTCANSCGENSEYKREFVWKQDYKTS